jgi:DNA-binding GntR family transcriptional regulator
VAARTAGKRNVNAGPTAERVYETLKQAIMGRRFRPGERLDPVVLAERLHSSTTPIREALDRLIGEGLVESRTGGGFFLPSPDEPGLTDMYDWCGELLALALRHPRPSAARAEASTTEAADAEEDRPLAMRTADLFTAIGQGSANAEHARAIARLNARLHAARTVEPLVIEDAEAELATLKTLLGDGDTSELRHALAAYHRRRVRAAAAILRALYRAD